MIKLKDLLLEVAEGGKGSGRKKKKGDKKWKGLGYDSFESVQEADSFDNVAKGWVKYFLRRHGKDIFKKVIAGREKERGKYSITDSDLWDLFGYYQHKDRKFGDWMGALAMIDFTLVSDMLGKEFSKKYPVEW